MTRALLFLALIAQPAIASTPTIEVLGYTDTGEYVRLRGVMLGASYVSCPAGPCLDVVASQVNVVGDEMFTDGFEIVAGVRATRTQDD